MIQRIQSVYWLLVIILTGLLFFVPLFNYGTGDNISAFTTFNCTLLSIAGGLVIAISVLAIFLFKNRSLQIKLGYLNLISLLASHMFVWVHYYFLTQGEAPATAGDAVSILPWVALPTVAFVFNLLAIKGVKRDEKLVKSVDRLRD